MKTFIIIMVVACTQAYGQPTTRQRLAAIEARRANPDGLTVAQRHRAGYAAWNADGVRPMSLSDEADAIELRMGFRTTVASPAVNPAFAARPMFTPSRDGPAGLGLGQGGPNLRPEVSRRLQRDIPVQWKYVDPRTYTRPIVHPEPAIPHGATRWVQSPFGGTVPDYTLPYGRRGNYKFAGFK